MSEPCMLTTFDNPFNPFKDFDSWYNYDMEKGYNTCGTLARVFDTMFPDNYALTDEQKQELSEKAMDELIKQDILSLFTKVYENTVVSPVSLESILESHVKETSNTDTK